MTSKKLHSFDNNPDQWYVEEEWADDALFANVTFRKPIYDPCCGMGRIPQAAIRAGLPAWGSDIADRGSGAVADFFAMSSCPGVDIVSNPPYNYVPRRKGTTLLSDFIDHALKVTDDDASVCVFTRLSFLGSDQRHRKFTEAWPVRAVLVCSDRVNCLPGANLLDGEEPGGGAIDYCWLLMQKQYVGFPMLGWLAKPTELKRK